MMNTDYNDILCYINAHRYIGNITSEHDQNDQYVNTTALNFQNHTERKSGYEPT